MRSLRICRDGKAAAGATAVVVLALLAVSCRKKADQPRSPIDSGTNMPVAAMAMSMAGKKMPTPGATNVSAAAEKMNMGDMQMPGTEHTALAVPPPKQVAGRSPVDLDLAQRQFINIRTRPVTRGEAVLTIRTVGIIAYDETRLANVNTRIMGWAQKLYVDKPGQYVEQGAPLMDIYSPELYSAQYEYLLAFRHCERLKHVSPENVAQTNNVVWLETVTEAQTLMKSARKRLELWQISDGEINALEKSGKPTDTLQLRAPVTGYVVQKDIDPAQVVMVGKTLYRVADLTRVWINADIYEYELPSVKEGQKVKITALAYPGRVFDAVVDFIYPYSENKTRTTTARLVMDNHEGLFKPNDYVNAEIKIDRGQRLLISQTAVYDTGVSQYVFVEATEGHFVPRLIKLGPTVGDRTVVIKGLAEGEKVVVDGNFLLDSESQLRASAAGDGP